MADLGSWIRELRGPFLVLPLIFVALGVIEASLNGFFNPLFAALTFVGVISLHASANILNDYFDFASGIDLATTHTPFSGGSGILPAKKLVPAQVRRYGSVFLAIGVACGLYLFYALNFDLLLLTIFLATVVVVYSYSKYLAAWGLGEFATFLVFGPLLLIGVYYVQARVLNIGACTVGLVTGLMTAGILYANEFPDFEADNSNGRRNLVVRLGKEHAAQVFSFFLLTPFPIIVGAVALGMIPIECLLGLFALPIALKAVKLLQKNYLGTMEMIPAMGTTIKATILTTILLFAGYVVALLLTWLKLPI